MQEAREAKAAQVNRVLVRLRAIQDQLPVPPTKAGEDPSVLDRYNRLVTNAQEIVGEDLSEYLAPETLITTKAELSFGQKIHGAFTNKVINLSGFRPIIAEFIATLENDFGLAAAKDGQAPTSTVLAPGGQVTISMAGRDSNQTVSIKTVVQPGDTAALISALRELGLDDVRIDDLKSEIRSAGDDQKGALTWFGNTVTDIAAGTISGLLVGQIPSIATLIAAHATGII